MPRPNPTEGSAGTRTSDPAGPATAEDTVGPTAVPGGDGLVTGPGAQGVPGVPSQVLSQLPSRLPSQLAVPAAAWRGARQATCGLLLLGWAATAYGISASD